MRYWLLTSEYPPFFGGGISAYCSFTAKMLVQNGHQVSVFINDGSVENISEAHVEGVRIIRFNPHKSNAASFLGHTTSVSYAFAQTLQHYIEKEGAPDMVEAQEYLGIAYYLLQYKHLQYQWCRHIPVLITMHSPSFLYMQYNHISEYKYPNYWICEMERFCLQAANALIAPSRYILREVEKHFHISHPDITVVPNPFESALSGNETDINTNSGDIIFYGKLTAQKGVFQLLTYFKQLWDEGFKETLVLIGGQDIVYHPEGVTMGDFIRSRYQDFIASGLLRLKDKIAPAQMPQRLSNAKVIIIPSANDNLPYTVLEMMALGNIVLVSKQGGQSEVVADGVDGFVFDHEAPQTFKEKLFQILMLPEAERQAIQTAAREKTAAVYNLQTVYEQKIAVIKNIMVQNEPRHFPFTRSWAAAPQPPDMGFRKSLLSVVVPYYNMGRYIGETIASLQKSAYGDLEILIVNDGSTNAASLQALESYRNKSGIIVIDTPNGGLAHARNTGARAAAGEYLAFLDADDTVAPDYYAKAIGVLKKFENVHFVGCWAQYFEGSVNVWPTFTPEPPLVLYHNTINSSSLVYKRAAFLHKGRNDARMTFPGLEDYESVISLLEAGYRGVSLPEPLFSYRVRTNSMIRAISTNKKLHLLQYIAEKHKKFYAIFAAEIVNLLQANGPGLALDNPTLDYVLYSRYPVVNKLAAKAVLYVKAHPRLKKLALTMYRKLKS